MCEINNCAKEILKKVCEKENGIIECENSPFAGKIVLINGLTYKCDYNNFLIQEAFYQLEKERLVEHSFINNKSTYYVTNKGYELATNLEKNYDSFIIM